MRSRFSRAGLLVLWTAGVAAAISPCATAFAHGAAPEVYGVIPRAGNTPSFATTYGLVVRIGSEWRWGCSAAMGRSPSERATVVATPGGEYLSSTFNGLRRTSELACGGELASPLLDRIVIDIVADAADPMSMWALTSDGREVDNGVFRSIDGGASWSATNGAVSPLLFERLRVAPSDSSRIYLSGSFPRSEARPQREIFAFRSSDGGATFEEIRFPFVEGERNLFLLGVDPNDPDVVYAHVAREVDSFAMPERLIVSRDGAATWETLLTFAGRISGFAIHDGDIFVSSPQGGTFDDPMTGETIVPEYGLWVSEDEGATFEHRQDSLSVGCLESIDGELWACSSSLTGEFDVGRSADGGRTFEAVFVLDDLVGPTECPGDRQACLVGNTDLIRDYALDICLEEPCPTRGAGLGVTGGACAAGESDTFGLVALLGLLFLRRRQA